MISLFSFVGSYFHVKTIYESILKTIPVKLDREPNFRVQSLHATRNSREEPSYKFISIFMQDYVPTPVIAKIVIKIFALTPLLRNTYGSTILKNHFNAHRFGKTFRKMVSC